MMVGLGEVPLSVGPVLRAADAPPNVSLEEAERAAEDVAPLPTPAPAPVPSQLEAGLTLDAVRAAAAALIDADRLARQEEEQKFRDRLRVIVADLNEAIAHLGFAVTALARDSGRQGSVEGRILACSMHLARVVEAVRG